MKLIKIDGYWIIVNDEEIKTGDKLFLTRENMLGKIGDIITVVNTRLGHTEIIKANGNKHWFACEVNYQREDSYLKVIYSQNPEHNLPSITFSDEVELEMEEDLENEWVGTWTSLRKGKVSPVITNNSVKVIKIIK